MSDNDSDRRLAIVTLRCKRSDKYALLSGKLKPDETGLRKCECPFKLYE